jgi:hypothetical protein
MRSFAGLVLALGLVLTSAAQAEPAKLGRSVRLFRALVMKRSEQSPAWLVVGTTLR